MPTTALYTFQVKTVPQIRDDILRVVFNGLVVAGVANPNIQKGSDYWILATAVAIEISVSQSNTVIKADAGMPDTAGGADLDRWLSLFGLGRRLPVGSTGLISVTSSVYPVLIATGTQLTDSGNLRYQVTAGGFFASGQAIPIAAIDTGSGTNHANGDVLKWVSTPAFLQSTATVGTLGGTDGLTGGNDGEATDDETPRSRLLARLQGAAAAGNWGFVQQQALQSPYVGSAFVYPGLYGPATLAFAVAAAPQLTQPLTSTSKNRDVNTTTLANTIVPAVIGTLPEHTYVAGFTVTNVPVDVALLLNLPSAPTASPPGPGGGWVDGQPWPSSLSGTAPVVVTAVTSSTSFTVNATTQPAVGTHISWLSPATWTLYTAQVSAVSGSSGAYVLTLSAPFPGIANGNHIFPASANQAAYVAALLQAFALMGPGELTASPSLLARAYRHPTPQSSWASSLNATQLRAVSNAGTEVLSAAYLYTSQASPGLPLAAGISAATNASPIVLTATAHGITNGQYVAVQGVLGNTAANGPWIATVLDANTLSLNGSVGNGAYTSGGTIARGPNQLVPRNLSFYAQ